MSAAVADGRVEEDAADAHHAVVAARRGQVVAGAGKEEDGKKARRSRNHVPYLDSISLAPHVPEASGEFWRRLLIQPVAVPELVHTGIRTLFDDPSDADLLGPDGKSTIRLKALIQTKVSAPLHAPPDFEQELAEDEMANQDPAADLLHAAAALRPMTSPARKAPKPKASGPSRPRPALDPMDQGPQSTEASGDDALKTTPKKKSKKVVKRKMKTKKRSKSKQPPSADTPQALALSHSSFKMFETMLDSVYGK